MPFLISGIIAILLFIGGVSVVKNNQVHPSVSPTPTVIQETVTSVITPLNTLTATLTMTQMPTLTPTPIVTAIPTPTSTLTPYPTSTVKPTATLYPTVRVIIPTSAPVPVQTTKQSGFQCNCSKTCPQMASCQEAYYQLINCGCSQRDGDKDGVPCEDICPGG